MLSSTLPHQYLLTRAPQTCWRLPFHTHDYIPPLPLPQAWYFLGSDKYSESCNNKPVLGHKELATAVMKPVSFIPLLCHYCHVQMFDSFALPVLLSKILPEPTWKRKRMLIGYRKNFYELTNQVSIRRPLDGRQEPLHLCYTLSVES